MKGPRNKLEHQRNILIATKAMIEATVKDQSIFITLKASHVVASLQEAIDDLGALVDSIDAEET